MVDHARKQVRDAAVSDLTGLPTTGSKVFTSRVAPLAAGDMPGLKIAIREESAEWDTFGKMARTGRLIVEGWLQGGDDIEDELDRVAAEVEAKIYADSGTPALSALLQNIGTPISSIDLPEPPEGTARRTGVIRMLFPVVYRTATDDPTSIV
ncbi:hypothetical protein LJR016_004316 [Devosia sp. LjRoot16]|uniref:hypothetical protein n=1 Tax=Devosia sp. LjRoot16 TaxID=3342271 RepID=UPI003ECE4496